MTNKERFVRSFLGCTPRLKLKPFLTALDVAEELMYTRGMSLEEIAITKDLYPEVAQRTGESYDSVARSIQRTASRCIECEKSDLLQQTIGVQRHMITVPSDLLFLLAAYLHTGKSFLD